MYIFSTGQLPEESRGEAKETAEENKAFSIDTTPKEREEEEESEETPTSPETFPTLGAPCQ